MSSERMKGPIVCGFCYAKGFVPWLVWLLTHWWLKVRRCSYCGGEYGEGA